MDISWLLGSSESHSEPCSAIRPEMKNAKHEVDYRTHDGDPVLHDQMGKPMRQCTVSDVLSSIGMWDVGDQSKPDLLEEENAKLQALLQAKDVQISLLQQKLEPEPVGCVLRDCRNPRPKAISRRHISQESTCGQSDCLDMTTASVPQLNENVGDGIASADGIDHESLDITRRQGVFSANVLETPLALSTAGCEEDVSKCQIQSTAQFRLAAPAQNQPFLGYRHNSKTHVNGLPHASVQTSQAPWTNSFTTPIAAPLQHVVTANSPYVATGHAHTFSLKPPVVWQSLPVVATLAPVPLVTPFRR